MELIDYIVDLLFWIIVWSVVFRLLFAWLERRLAQRLEREVGPIIRDLDSGQLIPLTVELHDNQFLCYNSLTDDFVCQGHTLTEIAQRFNQRYPGRRATIHRGDSDAISKLRQQIQDGVDNITLPAG